jgi:hypothetical protein
MKILNENELFIETADLVAAGFNINTIYSSCRHGYSTLPYQKDPSNAKLNVYPYEKLGRRYKEAIEKFFGNPYDHIAREPIKAMVKPDHAAEEFYLTYRYDEGKSLPPEHVKKYSKAASWLNMLVSVNKNPAVVKKQLHLKIDEFYNHVYALIKTDGIDLPVSYKRLRKTMAEYQEKGYESLIDWRFGNKLAAKVNDDFTSSLLLELISHPNQHDDFIIAQAYNAKVVPLGYKAIDRATVGVHRRNNYYLLQGAREGNTAWYNTYGKVILRNRPSAPLLLVGSDDNDLDLYFRDERKGKTNPYYRFKLIVLMDAYNDYILGYAYGETVTADLIKAAYLDAMYHVKEITGGWYLMNQIQSDRWGLSALGDFYKSMAVYTPATAKVARAKYIEQAFGKTWHQTLKMYPNYAGTNITSQSRINRDNLELQKRNFPTIDEGLQYIEDFINRLRHLPDRKTGISRQQQWITAFNNSDLSRQHQISDARMLHLFGVEHTHSHTITNGGIKVSIEGQQFVYDVPDDLYLQNVGKKVKVTYDPYDYSRVLVTDGGSLRFVAREFEKMSSAIADYKDGERSRLNHLLLMKKNHVQRIADSKNNRVDVLERHAIDASSLLQAQVLTKELKQNAELQYQQAQLGEYNPLDQM